MFKNYYRRMFVEMDKVFMNVQRMKQRRVLVETENLFLGGYFFRRRWFSDFIYYFIEVLYLFFYWKRRIIFLVVILGVEGEVIFLFFYYKYGYIYSSFISFTRIMFAIFRKRKNFIFVLAVVVLEDGVVELVRILLFIIVLDFVFFLFNMKWCLDQSVLCRVNKDVNYNDLIFYDVYELCIVYYIMFGVIVDQILFL